MNDLERGMEGTDGREGRGGEGTERRKESSKVKTHATVLHDGGGAMPRVSAMSIRCIRAISVV
jgi:hypothetical protein